METLFDVQSQIAIPAASNGLGTALPISPGDLFSNLPAIIDQISLSFPALGSLLNAALEEPEVLMDFLGDFVEQFQTLFPEISASFQTSFSNHPTEWQDFITSLVGELNPIPSSPAEWQGLVDTISGNFVTAFPDIVNQFEASFEREPEDWQFFFQQQVGGLQIRFPELAEQLQGDLPDILNQLPILPLPDSLQLELNTMTGSNAADRMEGSEKADLVRGLEGDDLLIGNYGNDILNGYGGADTLMGSKHNDLLTGGTGDDVLMGGKGFDTLIGVDPSEPNPGVNEVDWLYGDRGADYFILGSGNQVFYDDGSEADLGVAIIADFDVSQDVLQLVAGEYIAVQVTGELEAPGIVIDGDGIPGLSEGDNLIAIVQRLDGGSTIDLTATYVEFI